MLSIHTEKMVSQMERSSQGQEFLLQERKVTDTWKSNSVKLFTGLKSTAKSYLKQVLGYESEKPPHSGYSPWLEKK
jgi:hypothetical protein